MSKHQQMLEAHQAGRADAKETFATLASHAMTMFPDSVDVQFSYLAGYVQELRRLTTKI